MKSKVGIALLWVLVFLLGGVAGALSQYLYREHTKPARTAMVPPRPGEIINRMALEFDLNEQQVNSLKSIFAESRKKYRALGEQYKPHWEAIRNETDEQIKQILNPAQKAKYEMFLKKVSPPPNNRPRQTSK